MSRFDDLLTDDDLRTAREPLKEPAKRWRNKWRALVPILAHFEDDSVREIAGGDEFWTHDVFPTKDVAESVAAKADHWPVKYLGAFPVEEPNET